MIHYDLVYCWIAIGWRLGLGQVVMPLIRLGYAYDTMVVTVEKCGVAPKQIF